MLIPESELIINRDGSIYHLNLLPEQVANDVITVGDPDRVDLVAKHFDNIECTITKREFKTVTGTLGDKRITILSTGIGTDNIDIVLTELDALVNIDFTKRIKKDIHTSLNIYRIGTSGALLADISVDSTIISAKAIGLDGLMHYYNRNQSEEDIQLEAEAKKAMAKIPQITPYVSNASQTLISKYNSIGKLGITTTATGFYGPQGRHVIAPPKNERFLDELASIKQGDLQVTNLEMETAGIYGMCQLLGHQAISFNAILANRVNQTFSNSPSTTVENLIENVLTKMIE